MVFRPKILGLQYILLLLRFLTFFTFFENPKKRDFLRFFALLHTFSRTMVTGSRGLPVSTSRPNLVKISQKAPELWQFMWLSAILNYYLAFLDHPRSFIVDLKLVFKFGVDWIYICEDISNRTFGKFGLKCLFAPPKFTL